jgi:hypothetical protein
MQYKKWLSTGALAAIAAVTTSVPALSQENRSDTTGHQTYSAPSVAVGTSSGNSRAVTLNDVAELLAGDLNQSLEQLAAAENAAKVADSAPRRIARRATKDCINPAFQARKTVESKLEQSKEFIEQVNQIQPEKAMW